MDWVSVKDRLPSDDKDVLVYHEDDDHITVGYFESENVSFYFEKDGSKFYTDDGWETEIPWAQKGHVTHWMPLPEPPRIQTCRFCENEQSILIKETCCTGCSKLSLSEPPK